MRILNRKVKGIVLMLMAIFLSPPSQSQVNFFYPDWFNSPTFYVPQNYSASACVEVENDNLVLAKDSAMKSTREEIRNYLSGLEGEGGEEGLRAAARGVYLSDSSRVIDTDKKKEFFCVLGSIPYAKLELAIQTGLSESELKSALESLQPAINMAAYGIVTDPESPADYLKNLSAYLTLEDPEQAEQALAMLVAIGPSSREVSQARLQLVSYYKEKRLQNQAWKVYEPMIATGEMSAVFTGFIDWFRESTQFIDRLESKLDKEPGSWRLKYLLNRATRVVSNYGVLQYKDLVKLKELYLLEPQCIPCLVDIASASALRLHTQYRKRLGEWSDTELGNRSSDLAQYFSANSYENFLATQKSSQQSSNLGQEYGVTLSVADPYAMLRDRKEYEAYIKSMYKDLPEPTRTMQVNSMVNNATRAISKVDVFKVRINITGETATKIAWRVKGEQRIQETGSTADAMRKSMSGMPGAMLGAMEQTYKSLENMQNILTGETYSPPSPDIEVPGTQKDVMLEIFYEDLDGLEIGPVEVFFDNPQL